MNNLAKFERGKSIVTEAQYGGPVQVTKNFTVQSQLSTTLLEKAISVQPPGSAIVPATSDTQQIPGYAVALSPHAQTPVTVEFFSGNSGSAPIFLKPGEFVKPIGKQKFTGFRWGIPFGWLGGGVATLHVFQSPDAEVRWTTTHELMFHRTTVKIQANTANPAAVNANYPMRFPWTNAVQSVNAISQAGAPNVGITQPTRLVLRLRTATVAAASDMRIIVTNPDDIGDAGFVDFTWPIYSASGFQVNGAALNEFALAEVDDPIVLLGGDTCALVFVDITAGQVLANKFVDVMRYGIF